MFAKCCQQAAKICANDMRHKHGAHSGANFFVTAVGSRSDRFNQWLAATYKSPTTLAVASEGSFGATTSRNWSNDVAEPGASNLVVLHRLGLNVLWWLTGEGSMFSDTERGNRWAKQHGIDPGHMQSGAQTGDRTPELVARIRDVLSDYE